MLLRMLLSHIKKKILLFSFSYKWRKRNRHNFTMSESVFPLNMVHVGNGTYGRLNVRTWNNPDVKLTIGSYCSIARNVTFMLSGEHSYSGLSTFPFKTFYTDSFETKNVSKGSIFVGDDVWFGENCIILSGVTIGQGAIIGAGSIVTKDIPPYAIYGGNRIIKYRFTEEIIERLLQFDFSKISTGDIKVNIDVIYSEITDLFFESDFYKEKRK